MEGTKRKVQNELAAAALQDLFQVRARLPNMFAPRAACQVTCRALARAPIARRVARAENHGQVL